MSASRWVKRSAFEALYFSGAFRLSRAFLSGVGAILTCHHVRPATKVLLRPNRSLEITPEFLEQIIVSLRRRSIDLISLDEAQRRLLEGDFSRRFVAFTFDDGYRDNLSNAWPILKRHGVPFALYVPSSFADGVGDLWWVALERVIAASTQIEVTIRGETLRVDCESETTKERAFQRLYWRLRALSSEREMRAVIQELAQRSGVETADISRQLCMDWSELETLASDPLVTIGVHTHSHLMLRKAAAEEARAEMLLGARRIQTRLRRSPRHFSYPVGDPTSAGPREFAIAAELGFATAVTTRPGVLFPEHRQHLHALPRLSVNGDFQRLRYFEVMLSGAATALFNRFRRVSTA